MTLGEVAVETRRDAVSRYGVEDDGQAASTQVGPKPGQ